jgi:hypothetical protein
MPNKISASYLLFNWPPGPIDIAVTIAGFALALAGFLLRRTELDKPEAERDGGRVRLGTSLLVVGGLLLFIWGMFVVFFLGSILFGPLV